jgi:chromosome segregation ATPase
MTFYDRSMVRGHIERRLRSIGAQLRSLRDDLTVSEEQMRRFSDEAEDARLRALVSETPLADREFRDADRHAERLRRHRQRVSEKIAELEAEQDALLDRLTAS